MGHFVLPQTEIDSTASTTGSDVAVRVHFNDVSTRYTALSISTSLSICDVIAVTFCQQKGQSRRFWRSANNVHGL